MLIYLATLFLAVFLGWRMPLYSQALPPRGKRNASFSPYSILLVALLSIVVGWRNGVGTDYGNYIDIYSLSQGLTLSKALENKEPLFGLLNALCARWFDSYIPVFVICAFLTCALIVYGIRRGSTQYWLSIFLFITGMYYFDLFNGMRQMIATAMMFAVYPLAVKRKWLPVLVTTLIAYGFHTSAPIVLLAFLFAVYTKPGSVFTWSLIGLFSLAYFNFSRFSGWLIAALHRADSVYANYEDFLSQLDLGANFLRFALAAVPVVLGGLAWHILKRQRSDAGVLLNLSIINALFMLISTRNWIFARFSMFFGIYNILLWPELLTCFEPKSKRLMTLGVVGVYFVYFWLIVHTDSNLLPYRSWLFGGTYA